MDNVPEEESEEPMRSLSPERPFDPWEESEDPEEPDDPRPGNWRSSTLVGAVRAEVVRARRTREYFILTKYDGIK